MGSDPNDAFVEFRPPESGWSYTLVPLYQAARNGHEYLVRYLLAYVQKHKGCQYGQLYSNLRDLAEAAALQEQSIVALILDKLNIGGWAKTCDNSPQRTYLIFCAIVMNNMSLAAKLLERECCTLYKIEEVSPVTLAIKCSHQKIFNMVLDESIRDRYYHERDRLNDMLFEAGRAGEMAMVQTILNYVDADMIQLCGLDELLGEAAPSIGTILLECFWQLSNQANDDAKEMIVWAVLYKSNSIVERMLRRPGLGPFDIVSPLRGRINSELPKDCTLLEVAAGFGDVEVFDMIVNKDASTIPGLHAWYRVLIFAVRNL
jgi:hypothetical protein